MAASPAFAAIFDDADGQPVGELTPAARLRVRAAISAQRQSADKVIGHWKGLLEKVSKAHTNLKWLGHEVLSEGIEEALSTERRFAADRNTMLERASRLQGQDAALLRDADAIAVEVLETLRDVRWALMSLRVDYTDDAEVLPPMSVAEMRRWVPD